MTIHRHDLTVAEVLAIGDPPPGALIRLRHDAPGRTIGVATTWGDVLPGDVVLCREPWDTIDVASGYPYTHLDPAEELDPGTALIVLQAGASEFERELVEAHGGTWRAAETMPDWAVVLRVDVTEARLVGSTWHITGRLVRV